MLDAYVTWTPGVVELESPPDTSRFDLEAQVDS